MKTQRVWVVFLSVAISAPVWAKPPSGRARRPSQVENLYKQLQTVQASLDFIEQQLAKTSHRTQRAISRIENSERATQLLRRERAPKILVDGNWVAAPPVARDPFGANEEDIRHERDRISKFKADDEAMKRERTRLEALESELWARIAAAVVDRRNIDERTEYSFVPGIDPTNAPTKDIAEQRAKVVELFVVYLRIIDKAVKAFDEAAHENPRGAYVALLANSEMAHKTLVDDLKGLPTDVAGQTDKLRQDTKELKNIAKMSSNSNRLAHDPNPGVKATNRNQLRENAVAFATLVLDIDDGILDLCEEWKVRPQLDKPLPDPEIKLAVNGSHEKPTTDDSEGIESTESHGTETSTEIAEAFPLNSRWSGTRDTGASVHTVTCVVTSRTGNEIVLECPTLKGLASPGRIQWKLRIDGDKITLLEVSSRNIPNVTTKFTGGVGTITGNRLEFKCETQDYKNGQRTGGSRNDFDLTRDSGQRRGKSNERRKPKGSGDTALITKIFPLNSTWSVTGDCNGYSYGAGRGTVTSVTGTVATMEIYNKFGKWELTLEVRGVKILISHARGLEKGGNADTWRCSNISVSGNVVKSDSSATCSLTGTWTVRQQKDQWEPRSEMIRYEFTRE